MDIVAKLKQLYEDRSLALNAREVILEKDEPTEADKATDAELKAKVDAATERIQALEELQKEKARTISAVVVSETVEASEIEVSEPNFIKDPKKGFSGVREYLSAVQKHGELNGRTPADERLAYLLPKYSGAVGSDEQMLSSDAYGGFLVPTGLAPGVLSIAPEDDILGPLVQRVPLDVPRVEFNARVDKNHTSSVAGGITFTRTPETTAGTSSRMQFEQIVLDAKELVGLTYAANRVLTYSPSSFVAMLQAGFSQALTGKLTDERINGSGTGQFQGVLASPALISQAEESTQTNATIIYENVINMRARCWGYNRAVWLGNHDILPQLMTMNFTSSAIAPIWQPSLREDHPDMLLGRPIIFTEFCQTLGTVGDLILANMSQYLEGTLQPLDSAESIHVRFENRETAFRFTIMNDARGAWTAALTPAKSSTTLSPFVALATRS